MTRQTLLMTHLVAAVLLCPAICPASAAGAAAAAPGPEPGAYTAGRASRDGTGKRYLGREIAQVMGHLGAGWLERPDRERSERTDLLIEMLPLEPDSQVADVGAGTGYFTFPVAAAVPQGQVFAVDIQPEMLELLGSRQRALGIDNVTPVLGSLTDPKLPAASIDLVFIVDAYHEFSHPYEMGQALFAALKPGGRLVLIEYRMEDRSVPIKRLHKMSQRQVKLEMAALGLRWLRTRDDLPQQHFMIFEKPPNRPAAPSTTVVPRPVLR
ncbi:MAG: class I SAM-dependent methyltransferase [Pseudomonadota bacterium]